MKKVMTLIPLMLVLTSCEQLENLIKKNKTRPLIIFGTNMRFNVLPKNNLSIVSVTGIWKNISDQTNDELNKCSSLFNFPHSVKIKCYKHNRYCTISETVLRDYDTDNYYLTSYELTYYIKFWDTNKIVATNDDPLFDDSIKHCGSVR